METNPNWGAILNSDILEGKSILITGGTGSLGSHFIKHILKHNKPRKVICYSRDELKQSILREELSSYCSPGGQMRFLIGDIRDKDRLEWAFRDVNIVIHSAAMKQVPACEYNPEEAIKTNIDGTKNIVNALKDTVVSKAIFISSDKAVLPLNHYGKTKAVGESLWIASNVMRPIFSCTRWGNIEGSRGSIIPVFKDKIKRGERITITDLEMTRFSTSFKDAISTIFQALSYPSGLIWCRKSPSYVMSLVAAAFGTVCDIVGPRPMEKTDETLVSEFEVPRAMDIGNEIYIKPDPPFDYEIDYELGGIPLSKPYNSYTNPDYLTVDQIKDRIRNA